MRRVLENVRYSKSDFREQRGCCLLSRYDVDDTLCQAQRHPRGHGARARGACTCTCRMGVTLLRSKGVAETNAILALAGSRVGPGGAGPRPPGWVTGANGNARLDYRGAHAACAWRRASDSKLGAHRAKAGARTA